MTKEQALDFLASYCAEHFPGQTFSLAVAHFAVSRDLISRSKWNFVVPDGAMQYRIERRRRYLSVKYYAVSPQGVSTEIASTVEATISWLWSNDLYPVAT